MDTDKKSSSSQVINDPNNRHCCLMLPDAKDTGGTLDECSAKSNARCCLSWWQGLKLTFLTGTVFTILIIGSLRIMFYIMFLCNVHSVSDLVYPEAHMDRNIEENYPLSKNLFSEAQAEIIDNDSFKRMTSSFRDMSHVTSQITPTAEDHTRNFDNDRTRFKRDLSRHKRDCNLSVDHCKQLLQSMQNYLETLTKFAEASPNDLSRYADILMCLECKNLKSITSHKFIPTPQPNEQYFPHDYANYDHLSDSAISIVKLLDSKGINDDSALPVNPAGNDGITQQAAKLQILKTDTSIVNNATVNVTNASTVIAPIDRINSKGSSYVHGDAIDIGSNRSMVSVHDKQSTGSQTANNSKVTIKIQSGESVGNLSNIDGHREKTENNDVKNNIVTPKLNTTDSNTETTNYNTTSRGNATSKVIVIETNSQIGSTKANMKNPSIDLAKQIVITENATNGSAGYVSGISNGSKVYPSVDTSLQGHLENQSDAVNGSRSATEGYHSLSGMPFSYFQTKNDRQVNVNPEQIAESLKTLEQLQLTPSISWTIPHPVCFHRYPGQSSNKQGQTQAYYPSSSGPSSMQHRLPFQNAPHQTTGPSNYVQVQAQSVQFLPRLNYINNMAPAQQVAGSTGPATANLPTYSGSQQLNTASGTLPYFCTYISLPILRFPPMSGMPPYRSQSVSKDEDPVEPPTNINRTSEWLHDLTHPRMCPLNSRPCITTGHCILKVKWCDGRIDCSDNTDETMCSCRERISRDRLCDGYFDCPHGEDEFDCFGCALDNFSCDDEERRYSHENCVPLSQRCDGVEQCPNGKDEMECNLLSANYINKFEVFTMGYSQGYLHKNVRGNWYPVCSNIVSWAVDACSWEAGQPISVMPEIRGVRVQNSAFQGPYVTESGGEIQFVDSCPDTALFVKCPPLPCGTRVVTRQDSYNEYATLDNLYRSQTKKQPAEYFDKVYQEIIDLFDRNRTELLKNENSTIVGSQLRVVGGRASQPRAWPFLVAIYKDGIFHCGGVILDEFWILTAAHCLERNTAHYYEVQAGILRQSSFSPTVQIRKAKYIIVHPNYSNIKMQNDIGLIKLGEALRFNRWIRQVCLPSAETAGPNWRQGPPTQTMCIAIGWGALKERGPDPDHLREVEVPILSSCKYPSDKNDAAICAGYPQGGHDACQGDSGGPLMCRNPYFESQWYVAGIISHGEGCARPNEPGAYMKVSHFSQWINELFRGSLTPNYESIPLSKCPGFSCEAGFGKCLSVEQHCNGIVDCLEAEDEMDCGPQFTFPHYRQSDFNNKSMEYKSEKKSMETTEEIDNSTTEEPSSTETVPSTTSYNTEYSSTDIDMTTFQRKSSSIKLTFTCTKLIQTIAINKRCDRHFDCEDGTDEDGCTCKDFLLNSLPTAICDGHLDCDDKTDEKNCGICREDELLCRRSGVCIPITNKCDSRFNCPLKEDELDCLTLSDGKHVLFDSNYQPSFNIEGLISRYRYGEWHVECLQSNMQNNYTYMSLIGQNLCNYIGFGNVQSVESVAVNTTELELKTFKEDNITSNEVYKRDYQIPSGKENEMCSALWIRCRPVVSSSADKYLTVDSRTGSYTYLWPWLAAIFVDGRYRCSALLLEPNWLLSDSRCTQDIRLSVNYTAALLGRSRSYLYVDGPHQQTSAIDEIKYLSNLEISLLHLKDAVNITNQVHPLFIEHKIYPPASNDLCVAVGTDKNRVTQSLFLQPVLEDCDKCNRCYVSIKNLSCPFDGAPEEWNGMVFCRSSYGWYPTAVFHENDGFCSFQNKRNLTSIDYTNAYLSQALEETLQPISEPTCDGIRCNIGQCIPWDQVCDGVLHCRDGADEKTEICNKMQMRRNNSVSCKPCSKSELQCGNGECISKSFFCDGKVDCLDGMDEPVGCTCADYLKLSAPERLCDGVRHCFDKTDESPEMCQCTESRFKCNTESGNTCISQDFVCDGEEDCPNGEDETQCKTIQAFSNEEPNRGEVKQRSFGVWHTKCYSTLVTSQKEAKEVCKTKGYSNGIIENENIVPDDEPLIPLRNDFYMIRLNAETWITMRDNKPLVTLVKPEEPCYHLYVNCFN